MNRDLKSTIERGMFLVGVAHVSRWRHRNRALVLLYHNIVPDETQPTGELSLHLPLSQFGAQLDVLAQTCDVVRLQDVIEPGVPSRGRVRVAITFDDAYADALTTGIPELVRRQMPASIFVTPGLLGRQTWWDVTASETLGEIPKARRAELLTKFAGTERKILGTVKGDRLTASMLPRIANEAQLLEAAKLSGVAIASHTWSHPNLAVLSPDELQEELSRSLTWIRERLPSQSPFLSYPYGL